MSGATDPINPPNPFFYSLNHVLAKMQRINKSIKIDCDSIFFLLRGIGKGEVGQFFSFAGVVAAARCLCSDHVSFCYKKCSFYYTNTQEHIFCERACKQKVKRPLPEMSRLGAHRLDTPTISNPFPTISHLFDRIDIYIYIYI